MDNLVRTKPRPILRYDLAKAYKEGVSGSAIEDMINLGYKVTNYEYIPFGNCAIIEVVRVLDLTNYLLPLYPCWEFEYKHPLN